MASNYEKDSIEIQFDELMELAKETYPDIEDYIAQYSDVVLEGKALSEYFDILNAPPAETYSNTVTL